MIKKSSIRKVYLSLLTVFISFIGIYYYHLKTYQSIETSTILGLSARTETKGPVEPERDSNRRR